MLMTAIDDESAFERYGELAGVRVLITGLSPTTGVDFARAFADHCSRLVLQTAPALDRDSGDDMLAVTTLLGETAHEIAVVETDLASRTAARRLAQRSVKIYGGLDCVVNLVTVDASDLAGLSGLDEIEALAVDKLSPCLEITRVVANRMRVLMTGGSILNVVTIDGGLGRRTALVAAYLRSALATLTRREAQAWAAHGIRINAIGPPALLPGEPAGLGLASEPEMAAVALFLASRQAGGMSGHVLDADGALSGCG